ncbi:hypothetical protein ABZM74_001830 [Weissella confusa]
MSDFIYFILLIVLPNIFMWYTIIQLTKDET